MYCVSVDGITRYGEFEFDPEQRILSRRVLQIDCDDGTTISDVLSIVIKDTDSGEKSTSETWIVFKGSKHEVSKTIDDELPMEQREIDALNKYLLESKNDKELCECFCTYALGSHESGSELINALRNLHQSIVASIYESTNDKVAVLHLS